MVEGMREGDVFFWRWKDEDRHRDCGPYRSYHCKSQKAVFSNGRLGDTFWNDNGSEAINEDEVVLEYKGNVNEMTPIYECEIDFYEREDVVDMRHPNSSLEKVYVKSGAKRSERAMREWLAWQWRNALSERDPVFNRMERLHKIEEMIRAGKMDEVCG